jgi:hypothetical protein
MFDQVPYCGLVMFLVSRRMNAMPVNMLSIWAVNMMRPEYWILSSLLATGFHFSLSVT